jgi:hypothetical protein
VCDAQFNRVKVKSPAYVALSHTKDSITKRSMLDIIRKNESREFLTYFPEYLQEFLDIKAKYQNYVGVIRAKYERIKDIADQKEFALKASSKTCSGILFGLRSGKFGSIEEGLAETNIKHLEKVLCID